MSMSCTAGDVAIRAGALINAWREQDFTAFDCELRRAGRRLPSGLETGFELERQELLESIAFQMRGAAQSTGSERSGRVPEVDVCLQLLEHLATR